MIQRTPEDTVLLLASRPLVTADEQDRLADVLQRPIDCCFISWRAETYQILPLLRAHIAACGAASAMPDVILSYMDNWSAVFAARSIEQFRALGEIVTLFEQDGIDVHLRKGAAIAGLLYPDPMTRPMQDLDIMIQPHDARRVQRLMYAQGYRHGVFVPDTGRFDHLYRKITKASLARTHALHSMTRAAAIASPITQAAMLPEWRRRQIKCAFQPDGALAMPVFVDFHVNLVAGMDWPTYGAAWRHASCSGSGRAGGRSCVRNGDDGGLRPGCASPSASPDARRTAVTIGERAETNSRRTHMDA